MRADTTHPDQVCSQRGSPRRRVLSAIPVQCTLWVGQTPLMAVFRGPRRRSAGRSPKAIWADWTEANKAGDADRAEACAEALIAVAPEEFATWFEAGLHAKARRQWERSAEWNERALDLFGPAQSEEFEGANPAAWNLGIAATALGDWETARRAWAVYGISELGAGGEPIDENFGMAPIRLNPDRPTLALEVVPHHGETEVVWCWRRSPAHAVIASVPLPESGHRFRDVLLHDGEPKGTRRHGDSDVSVFDEIARLRDSGFPTWQAQVEGATRADVDALGDVFGGRGLGVDNWSGINIMCSSCSHGTSGADHHHAKPEDGTVMLGIAGAEGSVGECLEEWRSTRPAVEVTAVDLLW
jgi:hypothetical protein